MKTNAKIDIQKMFFIKELLTKMQNMLIGDAIYILEELDIDEVNLHLVCKYILSSDAKESFKDFVDELNTVLFTLD